MPLLEDSLAGGREIAINECHATDGSVCTVKVHPGFKVFLVNNSSVPTYLS